MNKIPETVILDTQKRVYEHKENMKRCEALLREAGELYRKRVEELDYAKRQLIETLQFLEMYNSDAHTDWFSEVGVERPEAPEQSHTEEESITVRSRASS